MNSDPKARRFALHFGRRLWLALMQKSVDLDDRCLEIWLSALCLKESTTRETWVAACRF